jgi:hypothetical protein
VVDLRIETHPDLTPLTEAGVWGAEIRFSCREAVFVDQSAESISSLDA